MANYSIVRVAEQFPPGQGGLAPGMMALSKAQYNLGHRVTVITRNHRSSEGVDTSFPFDVKRINADSLSIFGWKATNLFRKNEFEPDVIHCHGPAAAPIILRKLEHNIPVVQTLHAVRKYQYGLFKELDKLVRNFETYLESQVKNPPRSYHFWKPKIAWELAIERYICQNADHLALVAEYFGDQINEYYGVSSSKYTVSYNGSDYLEPKAINDNEILAEYDINQGSKIILYAGRIDWVKRCHLLVEGLLDILKHEPKAHLIIAGDGNQFADLINLVSSLGLEEKVTLPGWIPHEKLVSLYQISDCFCLPSYWEGQSKVLLEAMSLKVPVIASEVPANKELLDNGRYGFLVSKPTPKHWGDKIIHVLENQELAERKSEKASKLVDQKYRWKHVAKRLDKAYQLLLSR